MSKASRNREIARAKIEQMRAAEARTRRRRTLLTGAGAAVVVIVAAIVIAIVATGGKQGGRIHRGGLPHTAALSTLGTLRPAPAPGRAGPEGVPIPGAPVLATTASAAAGAAVDGIKCQTSEQTLFHIHAHLTIVVNGALRQIPAGIGIPNAQAQNSGTGPFVVNGTCFYWLHTHATDGVIHIESPLKRVYTLGDFFDEWGQPLGRGVVGPARGHVVGIYNGRVYLGNPRDIPLTAHAQIQLEVGTPLVGPERITFPGGL